MRVPSAFPSPHEVAHVATLPREDGHQVGIRLALLQRDALYRHDWIIFSVEYQRRHFDIFDFVHAAGLFVICCFVSELRMHFAGEMRIEVLPSPRSFNLSQVKVKFSGHLIEVSALHHSYFFEAFEHRVLAKLFDKEGLYWGTPLHVDRRPYVKGVAHCRDRC